jgi:hypothetical protein
MATNEKKPISNEELMYQMEEMTAAFDAKHNVFVVNHDDELVSDEAIASFVTKAKDPKGPSS